MLSSTGCKLLIVDDLPENLLALEALIRRDGREVFKAQCADDALVLLLEHEFALAILDVQMPGMNGFELAELCLLYTSPSPRDRQKSRMPSSA